MIVINQSECGIKKYVDSLQKLTEWSIFVTSGQSYKWFK